MNVVQLNCLSMWQPWATLISLRLKEYETRPWSTPYRGPLVIHAAKASDMLVMCHQEPFISVLARHNLTARNLPLGAAVCLVDLVDCIKMTESFIARQSQRERALGNWKPGRYAWRLANIRPAIRPIAMSGRQSIFRSPLVRLEDFVA
jgi:activating signal cointegrator 1